MTKLLIVESPGKIAKLKSFLGEGWRVEASLGHVRDLPRNEMGIDIRDGFRPKYEMISGKANAVKRIKDAIKASDEVFLASDPDREGEAIAWHISILCKAELKGRAVHRVTFNSITRDAVLAAIREPRQIDDLLVSAQQTRRIIDRLVGYTISPLASRMLGHTLSAGRVQSVCLRLVVDREREVETFTPSKFWTLDAMLRAEGVVFAARLWVTPKVTERNPDPKATDELPNRELGDQLMAGLGTQGVRYQVDKLQQGTKTRNPAPPFTTSALQQAAAKGLDMSPEQVMEIAQKLYEAGAITYMRTDGVSVAPEAQVEARALIAKLHGADYVPGKPPEYQAKAENAQESHEGIRPTHVDVLPAEFRGTDDLQNALYDLIWRRFVASQMAPSLYRQTQVRISALRSDGKAFPFTFRAQGREPVFDGFLKLYEEPLDEDEEREAEPLLPSLQEGAPLAWSSWDLRERTTKAPPRFTEAGLIQHLERQGVGRPSTYAAMVSHLKSHEYVRIKAKRIVPTDAGLVLCDFLVERFQGLFDVGYTSLMERELDQVADGSKRSTAVVQSCWDAIDHSIVLLGDAVRESQARREAERLSASRIGEKCPKCGSDLVKKSGANGAFIGCSAWPDCDYTRGAVRPAQSKTAKIPKRRAATR